MGMLSLTANSVVDSQDGPISSAPFSLLMIGQKGTLKAYQAMHRTVVTYTGVAVGTAW